MAAAVLHTRSERFAEDNCHKHHRSDNKLKRGRQKTVSWPIDEKLCEVRHFLVNDAPLLLGISEQGICKQRSLPLAHNKFFHKESCNLAGYHPVEVKRARLMSEMNSIGNLAPSSDLSTAKRSPMPGAELDALMVIATPWHRPRKFIVDDSWLWAGGEDSTEVPLQQQREMRLFEAFYPRLASVPDSPAEPLESCEQGDDSSLSEIPLIPLEEEETQDVEHELMTESIAENSVQEWKEAAVLSKHGTDVLKHGDGISCSDPMAEPAKFNQFNQSSLMSEADSKVAAIAAAACMVVKSLGESDLVDEKLLLEILKNPSLLKSLTCSNQAIKNKSQVKNNDTASRTSQEPITSPLGKVPPDNGALLNASPVSVLARWEGSAVNGIPSRAEVASGSANIWQPAITISNPVMTKLPVSSLPSQASNQTTRVGVDFSQKGSGSEFATRAVPETCMSSAFNRSNLQELLLLHAYKSKGEARLSCQNGLLPSALCSLQSMPTETPSIGPSSAPSIPLSNSELTLRTRLLGNPPLGRLVQDAESKTLQAKRTVLGGVPPKMRGVPPKMRGGGRAKRFCMYFNSPRGCRNGGSCAFVHQSLDSELNTMAQ